MFRSQSVLVKAIASLCAILLHAQTSSLPPLDRFDPALADKTKSPCDSFYRYSCSIWLSRHPIPEDRSSISTGDALFLYNQTILRNAMEKAAANPRASGGERLIGDFWRSCMDEKGRNAEGKQWLKPYLAGIDAMRSKKDLARTLAQLHLNFPAAWLADDNATAAPLFGFGPTQDPADSSRMVAGIDQGGMALPSIDYYLGDAERYRDLRARYVKHMAKMFVLAGETGERAEADARTTMEMETALAKAAMDNVTRRDPTHTYNKRTPAQLRSAAPDFNWQEYFTAMKAPAVPFYIVTAPGFLTGIEQQIRTRSVADWRTYLRWWTMHQAARYLGDDFERENFDFFRTALTGTPQMQPRWRRCVASADALLGEALGQAYVSVAFPADARQRANRMVTTIRQTLNDEIRGLDWMSEETRKQALSKQDSTLQKIGYPDKWIDYSSVRVGPTNYLANMSAANRFEAHRQLGRIGKLVDRQQWLMTPPTIDAYEDPQMNTINFPAGILQPPFFSAEMDDAANLGATGAIVGHEAIHGFDDQGRKFDGSGNLKDWWTADDARRYEEKDKCIVEQNTREIPGLNVKQNGELTAGEDTADNGGLNLAMVTLERLYKAQGKSVDAPEADGLTARQRFFLAYAFSWCKQARPEAERVQVTGDPHSLSEFRVDRPLSNMPEFQQAFGCQVGAADGSSSGVPGLVRSGWQARIHG